MSKKIGTITMVAAGGVFLAGLALMAYIGFYNRYWAEDWCYNRDLKNLGIWGTLGTYLSTGEEALRGYSTNRYALTLLSALFYLPGVFGTQVLALVIILLWLGGLLKVIADLARIFGRPLPKAIYLFSASCLLYYTLYISPQRFQVLYWRSGVHYSFTIILGLYIAGLITTQIVKGGRGKTANYLIAPLAFFAGGLSETGCAYLLSAVTLLLLAAWWAKRKRAAWAEDSYSSILTALVSLLVSLIVLMGSPSNSRYNTMPVRSTDWPLVPYLSLKLAFYFIIDSLKSLPLPHLVFILLFFSASILSALLAPTSAGVRSSAHAEASVGLSAPKVESRRRGLLLLGIGLAVFLLIAAVQAPAVRFYSAPPDPRGQSLSRFTLLAGLAGISWLVGQRVSTRWRREWLIVPTMLGVILGTMYTTRLIALNYMQLPGFVYRAQLWDQRDRAIRSAAARGERRLDVLVIDTHDLSVQDIMPSRAMDGRWVRSCGSEYYGMEAIRAISP